MENEKKSKLNKKILNILNDGIVNGFKDNYLYLSYKYVDVVLVIIAAEICHFILYLI